jgi:UDP-N-acetylglucosamine--N-acetylmuramyl-(pentapeptide) pyrophosphoryl-undecaprenol N-acetylglucosamine transferase
MGFKSMPEMKKINIIVSGGGTGGHIFPAISIANALKSKRPEQVDILFVGAEGRMEMDRVPAAGYQIVGLPIKGFDRKNLLRNVKVLYLAWKSTLMAKRIVKKFKPSVAVGVGGYASGPLLKAAAACGVPTVIQEQNSYAGVTNKMLASKASKICVAYSGMERFFPKDKIILTGNPVRQDLVQNQISRAEAVAYYKLDPGKPVVLIMGGSLGARTLNNSVLKHLDALAQSDVQVIWQTGKYYFKAIQEQLQANKPENLLVLEFLDRMDMAYQAADLVVSRAGASSISELCLLGKAVILVPSPNVAEDHQTKNAMALVQENAAILVPDAQAENNLIDKMLTCIHDEKQMEDLRLNIKKLAQIDSADRIAEEILKLI